MAEPHRSTGQRGRPPRLHRDGIVDAALALLDENGPEALTTRALAVSLAADPTAIYRHFRSKDDLLAAVCDRVLAEVGPVQRGRPWRAELHRVATRVYELVGAHPGLASILAVAPVTPATLDFTQEVLDLLDGAGFAQDVAEAGFWAVYHYVLGALVKHPTPAVRPAPGPPPPLEGHDGRRGGAALLWSREFGDFDLGLRILLDGLATRTRSRRTPERLPD